MLREACTLVNIKLHQETLLFSLFIMVQYDGKWILLPCITFVSVVLLFRLLLAERLTCRVPWITKNNPRRKELFRVTDRVCAREIQYGADGEKYQEQKDTKNMGGLKVDVPDISGGVRMKSLLSGITGQGPSHFFSFSHESCGVEFTSWELFT